MSSGVVSLESSRRWISATKDYHQYDVNDARNVTAIDRDDEHDMWPIPPVSLVSLVFLEGEE